MKKILVTADERQARVLLNMVSEVGPLRFKKIIDRFGSGTAAAKAPLSDWETVEGLTRDMGRRIFDGLRMAERYLKNELSLLERYGARVLVQEDEEFPDSLKILADPPFLLYIRGSLSALDAVSVAIVGARRATAYGRAMAESLSRDLARSGITVVSGLARGIDTAAHVSALKNKGRTIGILGSGFDEFYPNENLPLFEKIGENGAVLSEYPMARAPESGNFPRRNRLISGISLAVVVVEAQEASGALITARLAAEQGREVFAVPGPVFSQGSRGPHRLLKQGARLLESVEDLFEELAVFKNLMGKTSPVVPKPLPALSAEEKKVLSLLSLDPTQADDLTARSGLETGTVAAVLLTLELKGLTRLTPGNAYIKNV